MERSPEGLTQVKGFALSPELFRTGYSPGCGPHQCEAHCCEGGVSVDLGERDRILANREKVVRHMDATQVREPQQWFEREECADTDFPSGKCVGTRVYEDRCVFLDRRGYCSLQVAAAAEGMHKWALKPLYCILYPIEITDGVIGFDPMLQDERDCCSVHHEFDRPLFVGCKEELTHLLGVDGYDGLRALHDRGEKSEKT